MGQIVVLTGMNVVVRSVLPAGHFLTSGAHFVIVYVEAESVSC